MVSRLRSSPVFFLLLFLPMAAIVAAGFWLFAEADLNQRLARLQAMESGEIVHSAGALDAALGNAGDDIAFLSRLPRQQEAILNPDSAHLDRLTDTYRVFADTKRAYSQIRWIDETGRERVRVDYDRQAGQARAVARDKLQDKSGRYYFTEASRLASGAIYLSPFDLNVEAGAIEQPLNPTLRLATPLITPDGQRHGIIVLNLFGNTLIDRMLAAVGGTDAMKGRLMLVNRDGYWLHGLQREDEWGFMFGQAGKTLAQRHPDIWQTMQAGPSGQAWLDDGLWTWLRVYPARRLQQASASLPPAAADDYAWTVVARLPTAQLAAIRQATWRKLVWPLAVFSGLGLLGCGLLTRYRNRVQALDAALLHRLHETEENNRLLATQERFIRTITDHLPSKVGYWDAQLRCRYANATYLEWFGKRPDEMLGWHARDVLGDELFAQNEKEIDSALAGQPQRFERQIKRFDGTSAWLLTSYIPDRVDDRIDGFYVLSTDITDIKEAGQQMKALNAELSHRVDEVLAATRAKDDFLSNMSHEIRTPLNAILGLAYLLDSHALAQEERDLVRKIRGAGRLLLGIISDILDYSKIEAGRLELEHAPFRLSDVLDGVAAIMATAVADKDIELTVDAVPAGAENLVGDALRLGQVINNLVSNAIKFTERGAVSVHVVPQAASGPGIRLRFSVCDTGIGIPADKQALIFNAFSQADTSTTRKYGGTGLGLSISRHLVHQMGGEIGVSSTPGKGSEFWFALPFDVAESSYAQPDMALQRVLIVDDSAIARSNLATTVQSLGWSAEAVESGELAVERCRTQRRTGRPFDLLLIDWLMPGMDGLATCRAIRTHCMTERTAPIIVMVTAHSRETLLHQPDAAAADIVLTKPLTASMLYNVVSETRHRLSQGQPRPPTGATPHGRQLPGLRLLVVDDSEINCEVAARILEREGAHVQTVADGQSALDWLRQWPDQVDAVLMDVQMPIMDGYEATQHIRGELGRGDLPVIALTAGAFNYQREAALAAGMNDFLAKPLDVDTMIATLQRLTGCQAEPAPVAADAAVATPEGTPALPGIDIARGLRAWGNDQPHYRRYLQQFATAHAGDGHAIGAACARGDNAAASALAHTLIGVAGNLALPDIERAARDIETALHDGAPASAAAESLQAAIDTVLASLARWNQLAGPPTKDSPPPAVTDPAAAAPLLRELLAALDHDNPRHATPILTKLAAYLPAESLHALGDRIDNFDFREAEMQCRAAATQLGISLE